jgi:hypothetical protein
MENDEALHHLHMNTFATNLILRRRLLSFWSFITAPFRAIAYVAKKVWTGIKTVAKAVYHAVKAVVKVVEKVIILAFTGKLGPFDYSNRKGWQWNCNRANATTAAPATAANSPPGICYEAFTPDYPECSGYEAVGYTCVGSYCAAMNPGGNPDTCAKLISESSVVDASTGRCSTPDAGTKATRSLQIDESLTCSNCWAYAEFAINMDFSIADYEVQHYSVIASGDAAFHLEGSGTVNATGANVTHMQVGGYFHHEFERLMATIHAPPITFQLGPVPVEIDVSVPIKAGYDLSMAAKAGVGFVSHASGSFKYGLEYDRQSGNGTQWIHEVAWTPPTLSLPGLQATVNLQLYVMPVPHLGVKYIGGVYVGLKPYIVASAVLSQFSNAANTACPGEDTAQVALNFGFAVTIGGYLNFTLPLLNLHLYSHEFEPWTIYHHKWPIATGCIDLPGHTCGDALDTGFVDSYQSPLACSQLKVYCTASQYAAQIQAKCPKTCETCHRRRRRTPASYAPKPGNWRLPGTTWLGAVTQFSSAPLCNATPTFKHIALELLEFDPIVKQASSTTWVDFVKEDPDGYATIVIAESFGVSDGEPGEHKYACLKQKMYTAYINPSSNLTLNSTMVAETVKKDDEVSFEQCTPGAPEFDETILSCTGLTGNADILTCTDIPKQCITVQLKRKHVEPQILTGNRTVLHGVDCASPTVTVSMDVYNGTMHPFRDLCANEAGGSSITFTGTRCGVDSIHWTALQVKHPRPGLSTAQCRWNAEEQSDKWKQLYTGSCGVAPAALHYLPMTCIDHNTQPLPKDTPSPTTVAGTTCTRREMGDLEGCAAAFTKNIGETHESCNLAVDAYIDCLEDCATDDAFKVSVDQSRATCAALRGKEVPTIEMVQEDGPLQPDTIEIPPNPSASGKSGKAYILPIVLASAGSIIIIVGFVIFIAVRRQRNRRPEASEEML